MLISKIKKWNRQKNQILRTLRLQVVCLFLDHKRSKPFNVKNIKSVLIMRDDNKIGDMIISTLLFREFQKIGITVSVVSGKDNCCVIEHNPNVKDIFFMQYGLFGTLKLVQQLRKKHFDLLIDLGDYLSPSYFFLISAINAKHTLGFNKSQFKTYDLAIDYQKLDAHITERYKIALEKMGMDVSNLNYDIFIPEMLILQVEAYLKTLGEGPIIVINPYTASSNRDMSQLQLTNLVSMIKQHFIQTRIILIGPTERIHALDIDGVFKNPLPSFLSSAAFVKAADLVISPDTSIVHVACAFNKKMISLYGNNIILGGFINNKVWAPNYDNAIQIIATNNQISSIPVETIFNHITNSMVLNT